MIDLRHLTAATVLLFAATAVAQTPTTRPGNPTTQPAAVEVDQSDPKAAIKSLVRALEAGDAAAVTRVLDDQTDVPAANVRLVAPALAAEGRFADACRDAFGRMPLAGTASGMVIIGQVIDTAKVQIDGDQAEVKLTDVPEELKEFTDDIADQPPFVLARRGDRWYVHPAQVGIELFEEYEEGDQQLAGFTLMVEVEKKVFAEMTDRVHAGDFDSLADAQEALEQTMKREWENAAEAQATD